jgi:uncharacterized membrane protein YfcA
VSRQKGVELALIGLAAGLSSGLFGIGGGTVLVPLLVWRLGFDQHRAHATSLAAIVLIAVAGAATFAADGEVDLEIALALALGGVIGAPLGARVMAGLEPDRLMAAFGWLVCVVGAALVIG